MLQKRLMRRVTRHHLILCMRQVFCVCVCSRAVVLQFRVYKITALEQVNKFVILRLDICQQWKKHWRIYYLIGINVTLILPCNKEYLGYMRVAHMYTFKLTIFKNDKCYCSNISIRSPSAFRLVCTLPAYTRGACGTESLTGCLLYTSCIKNIKYFI